MVVEGNSAREFWQRRRTPASGRTHAAQVCVFGWELAAGTGGRGSDSKAAGVAVSGNVHARAVRRRFSLTDGNWTVSHSAAA